MVGREDAHSVQRWCVALRGGQAAPHHLVLPELKDRVVSPTFSLVNEYKSDFGPIYHFDFYRLKNAEEALDIGTDEYLESGCYCFLEWSEIVESIFPERFVKVEIEPDENGTRHIHAHLVK